MANSETNIHAAFEMLLEEVENEVEFVNSAGARAFQQGDYERVDAARGHALELSEFRDEIARLRTKWRTLGERFDPEADDDEDTKTERRNLGRLQRGVRTPEEAYRLPILEALVELDGSGKVRDVMERVERKMQDVLNAVDYEPLPSNPNQQRWYNGGQWARNTMRQEGLLKDDSPRGTWEISEAGRRHFDQHRS